MKPRAHYNFMGRKSRAPDAPYQTALTFDEPAEPEPVAHPVVCESGAELPEYTITPKWIDCAGRTRTWDLLDPKGGRVAEIATKRDAKKLARILTDMTGGRGR